MAQRAFLGQPRFYGRGLIYQALPLLGLMNKTLSFAVGFDESNPYE
jgi:hypothetical protein